MCTCRYSTLMCMCIYAHMYRVISGDSLGDYIWGGGGGGGWLNNDKGGGGL